MTQVSRARPGIRATCPGVPWTDLRWKPHSPLCHPDRSEAERRDLQFHSIQNQMLWQCKAKVIFDGLFMGRRSTQGDENGASEMYRPATTPFTSRFEMESTIFPESPLWCFVSGQDLVGPRSCGS